MKDYFPIPDGLQLPEGSRDGSDVDLVARFHIEGSNLCLVAVEGIPVKKEAKAEEPSFEDAVEQEL